MKNEIWKDIDGYEGLYQVSNLGRVKSLDRYVHTSNGKIYHVAGKVLKAQVDKKGYSIVRLTKDGKGLTKKVHRLVAIAFILNSNNLPEVNHKDENKENNTVDNLEWCDSKYNNNFGTKKQRISKALKGRTNNPKMCKPIVGKEIKTGNIVYFPSAAEAERVLGIKHTNITQVCKGSKYYKSAGGYYWHYVENDSYNHYMSQNDREY